jgi:hypothetical protein
VRFQLSQVRPETVTPRLYSGPMHGSDAAYPVQTGSVPSVRPERNIAFWTWPPAVPAKSEWLQAMYLPPSTRVLVLASE